MQLINPSFDLDAAIAKIRGPISGIPDHTIPLKMRAETGFSVLRGSGTYSIANASANKCEVQTLWDIRTQVDSDYGGISLGQVHYRKYQSQWTFSNINQASVHPFIVVPVIVKSDGNPAATFESSKMNLEDIIDDTFAGEYNFQVLPPIVSRMIIDNGTRNYVAEFQFDATALFNKVSGLYYSELRNQVSSMFWNLIGIVFAVDDGASIGYSYVHFKETEIRNQPL
jgi:hypothetical protein